LCYTEQDRIAVVKVENAIVLFASCQREVLIVNLFCSGKICFTTKVVVYILGKLLYTSRSSFTNVKFAIKAVNVNRFFLLHRKKFRSALPTY